MTLSTTDYLNMSKLSIWEVFENPKHNPIIKNVMIEWEKMRKLILTSWGLNTLIIGSILLES